MTFASVLSRRWPWIAVLSGLLAVLGAGVYASRFFHAPPSPPSSKPPDDPADIVEQVHNFCGGACHAYPPPDTFPRRYWRKEVQQGFRFFEQSAMARKVPPFESVVRYYEQRAPEDFTPPAYETSTRPLDLHFDRLSYPGPDGSDRFAISNVKLVHLPEPGKPVPTSGAPLDILACDMLGGRVMLLRPYESNPTWKVLARVPNPAHTEVVDLDGDGILDILVANLGSFPPTDERVGSVVWLRGRADGSFTPFKLLDKVGRVADVRAAPFRSPDRRDLVVGVFGWQRTGELLFLENQTTDWNKPKFIPRVLDERHGTIHVPVADLNGDGKPDFVALISQEHETIVAFLNEGNGNFSKQTLYTAPHPGYGSSGIQLVDLDGDGKLDVLYTNGDVLDDPYLFKPYHSVQWLKNLGGHLRFEHRPLTPMYGTHRAVAADLFGTGRPAIVAVSFLPDDKFPDRRKHNADAIIVLEQVAPGKFERHSLAKVDCDHVTCAVGDLYGRGQLDIVVGNFTPLTAKHPVTILKRKK
jgi:hypothetical protein